MKINMLILALLALLLCLPACALAETSVTVMGFPVSDGDQLLFEVRQVQVPVEGGEENEDGEPETITIRQLFADPAADESWNVKYESGTLTLRDIQLKGHRIEYNSPAIVAYGDLELCLEGHNVLSIDGKFPLAPDNYRIGMHVGGNLEVSGEGSLNIEIDCAPDSTKDLAIINVTKDITVNSGDLTAEYDRAAVTGAWNSAAGVEAGGNITVAGGNIWSEAPPAFNGVAGIRAHGDITILGGTMDGYSYTCYMDENGDRIGGNTGAGVMSLGGSIILDGGWLTGCDNIQFGDTDYTGVRRPGAMGAGIYAQKDIIIKRGALWANALESEEGYALSCMEGEISILDDSLDIGAQEYMVGRTPWNGKISPGKRTIHTAEGKIARYVMIRDVVSPVPETGDSANIALWCGLLTVSVIGMAVLRRRKEA